MIDSENFTPRLLALLSNALVWRESRLLRQEFNLGTNDWRVISALSIRPGSTSTDISEFVAMNKAVVSKSVNTLIARELIVPADGKRGSRHLYLTRAGADMHDRMKPISLQGQEIVLADLSADEVRSSTTCSPGCSQKTPELSRAAGRRRPSRRRLTGMPTVRRAPSQRIPHVPNLPIDIPYVYRYRGDRQRDDALP